MRRWLRTSKQQSLPAQRSSPCYASLLPGYTMHVATIRKPFVLWTRPLPLIQRPWLVWHQRCNSCVQTSLLCWAATAALMPG